MARPPESRIACFGSSVLVVVCCFVPVTCYRLKLPQRQHYSLRDHPEDFSQGSIFVDFMRNSFSNAVIDGNVVSPPAATLNPFKIALFVFLSKKLTNCSQTILASATW